MAPNSASMVAGPRAQLSPDDIGARVFQALAGIGRGQALAGVRVAEDGEVDHRGQARRLDRCEREQGLAHVADGLGDDEVHALVHGPTHLLVEHGTHRPRGLRIAVHEDVGVAHIAGDERAALLRHHPREADRGAVHPFEPIFLADQPELLPMGASK